VSYFDLIDIRNMITAGNSKASDLMRQFHVLVYKSINIDMPTHRHAYAWNDSAMFLALPKNDGDYETIMRELNTVKPKLDDICHSYAICVKGQAMPEPVCGYGAEADGQSRFVFLRTSSYAFTNCFEVEEQLKSLEMDWYVDSRIARKIPSFPKSDRHAVPMWPSRRKRNVHVLKGSIWRQP
jgi:hypothetical protein